MSEKGDTSVLVFARAPIAGAVKTRLIPVIGGHGAAALQRSLVERTLAVAREADLGSIELWCAPDTSDAFFADCRERFGVSLHTQCDGDLGARMLNSLEDALGRSRHVLLIGSDCPSLSPADLRDAARALRDSHDAVFCPVEDGGYMLVGLSNAMPALFDAMPWGSDSVMAETRQRLRNLGWRWHELPVHWDVDRPEDYQRLVREGWFPATDSIGEP